MNFYCLIYGCRKANYSFLASFPTGETIVWSKWRNEVNKWIWFSIKIFESRITKISWVKKIRKLIIILLFFFFRLKGSQDCLVTASLSLVILFLNPKDFLNENNVRVHSSRMESKREGSMYQKWRKQTFPHQQNHTP